jgi:hypothetical protein
LAKAPGTGGEGEEGRQTKGGQEGRLLLVLLVPELLLVRLLTHNSGRNSYSNKQNTLVKTK